MGMGGMKGQGSGTGDGHREHASWDRPGACEAGLVRGERSWDEGHGTEDRGGYRGVKSDVAELDMHGGGWHGRRVGERERRFGTEGRDRHGWEQRDGSRDRDRDREHALDWGGGGPRRRDRDRVDDPERGRDWGNNRARRRERDGCAEERKGGRWRDGAGSGLVRDEERFAPGGDSEVEAGAAEKGRVRARGREGDRRGPRGGLQEERAPRGRGRGDREWDRDRDRERSGDRDRDRERERDRKRDRGEGDLRGQRDRERARGCGSPPQDLRDLLRRRRG
jgi:U1 small nuclear ribonucleoprotein